MTELSAKTADRTDIWRTADFAAEADSPPLAPLAHGNDGVIDLVHLKCMTGGDQHLQSEVLQLFAMQCGVLLARMQGAPPAAVAALAHTLNGSARGVGAWAVTKAAETVERCAVEGGEIAGAMERLAAAAAKARAAIAEMAHPCA